MDDRSSASDRRAPHAKRQRRRQDWTRGAILAAVVVAAAVAARALDEPTLRIAIHQGVEGVALRALARDFSGLRDVSVEVVELPYASLYDAELQAVTAERSPYDVIMVDDPWLPALIGEDEDGDRLRVERLEFTRDECARLALDDFVETTLRVSVHPSHPLASRQGEATEASSTLRCGDPADGLYALPVVGNSQLFLVRRTLDPPATWEDVERLASTSSKDDAGYVARVGAGNSIVTDFMALLWTLPGTLRDHPETLAALRPSAPAHFPFHYAQARASFEFVRRLGADGRANRGVISVDDFDLAIHLVNDKASMMTVWSAWVMALAKLPAPYNSQLLDLDRTETSTFTVTQVPGGAPVLGAWLLAIPARAPNSGLAREFLLWATAKDQMVAAAKLGNPPTRRSTFTARMLNELYPFFDQQLASLQRAQARPRTPFWRDIENVLGECLTTLYEGGLEPDEAWTRVNRGLEVLREKQQRIDAAAGREDVRAILDEPIPPFSCSDGS